MHVVLEFIARVSLGLGLCLGLATLGGGLSSVGGGLSSVGAGISRAGDSIGRGLTTLGRGHDDRTLSYRRLKRRARYQRPTAVDVTDQELSEREIPAASLEQAVASLPPQGTACQLWCHHPGQGRAVCMTAA